MLSCWLALALRLPLQMWNRAEARARKAWLKSASGDGDPEKYVKTDSGMKDFGKSASWVPWEEEKVDLREMLFTKPYHRPGKRI